MLEIPQGPVTEVGAGGGGGGGGGVEPEQHIAPILAVGGVVLI